MRPEKASIVSDLSEKLNQSPFMLVTDYQRMKVGQFGELRSRLAPSGAEVHVVKNTFLKRAMAESGMPDVSEQLTGQTAVVTGEKDVAPVAKILKAFAAEFKIAALKIGVVDKAILSTADVEALAELPAREVLLSQFLGLLLMPATSLVRVLNEPATAFARLLNAKAEQGGRADTGATPSAADEPAASSEAAASEAPAVATEEPAPSVQTEAPVAAETAAPAQAEAAASTSDAPTESNETKPAGEPAA